MINNDVSLIAVLAAASLLPFLIACGTCYLKFSIVFVMVRNAIGLQQIPSNMTLNGIALVLSAFVMMPVFQNGFEYYQANNTDLSRADSVSDFLDNGFADYKNYLVKYTDEDLARYFNKAKENQLDEEARENENDADVTPSLLALLPAYALSEIKDAFKIGFYIYLPFVVIDLLVSSILLTLGMMMMSPITISVPIKLLLFVVMDGWTLISKGLLEQYLFFSA